MLAFIVCIVCSVLFIWWAYNYHIYTKRANELFNVTDVLKVETLMLFSNEELVYRIMKILKKTGKRLNIQCGDDYYVPVPKDITAKELAAKLEILQDLMIRKRYESKNEIPVKDSIDRIIFDIWLDYGYKPNYRNILRREMAILLDKGDISNSTYNEIYRRAYMFERDALNKGGFTE